MKPARIILVIATLGLALTACGAGAAATPTATAIPTVIADTTIVTEGRLEPVRYTQIALNASGLVSDVLVKEGDTVTAGQLIATLKSDQAKTLEAARADASQELTASYQSVRDAQFKLDNFDVPTDFSGMTPSQAVEQMLTKLNAARDAYEPYKYLGPNNNTGREYKKRLDDAWAKYRKAIQWVELESTSESAQARLDQAQKDYDALQDTSLTENTAGVRAALANAEVRAPFAGVITTLSLKVGEFAASGQPVITIADMSQWVVKTTDLTEIDVVNIKEGQPVTIKLDAIPGAELKGNVLSIGQTYGENQGDVVYEVTVLLTDKNPAMRWGMTAAVTFEK